MITCEFEDHGKGKLRHVTVDTLVMRDNKILLVRRNKKLLEGGKWGLVGGFVGRDETLEQAAKREVLEETGWEVSELKLLRVIDKPNRPHEDRQNISFVFVCEALKRTGEADWESEEIRWFDLNALPEAANIAFDHMEDITLYKDHLKDPRQIPIIG